MSLKSCVEYKNQRFLFFGVLGDRGSMVVRERSSGHKLWVSLWTTCILSLLHPTGNLVKLSFFRAIVVNHESMVWIWCALTMADWQRLVYTQGGKGPKSMLLKFQWHAHSSVMTSLFGVSHSWFENIGRMGLVYRRMGVNTIKYMFWEIGFIWWLDMEGMCKYCIP